MSIEKVFLIIYHEAPLEILLLFIHLIFFGNAKIIPIIILIFCIISSIDPL